jgi:uncharacterized phosphatase
MNSDARTYVYCVRHARSRANETGVREGPESPLTERGVEQARRVAERFQNIPIEIVFASSATRARDTGKFIAEARNVPFELMEQAVERGFPLAALKLDRHDPKAEEAIRKMEEEWVNANAATDGEHFNNIIQRVDEVVRTIEERPEKHIALVSHGFFLRLFACRILFRNELTARTALAFAYGVQLSNTGITRYAVDKNCKWQLINWNDDAHL